MFSSGHPSQCSPSKTLLNFLLCIKRWWDHRELTLWNMASMKCVWIMPIWKGSAQLPSGRGLRISTYFIGGKIEPCFQMDPCFITRWSYWRIRTRCLNIVAAETRKIGYALSYAGRQVFRTLLSVMLLSNAAKSIWFIFMIVYSTVMHRVLNDQLKIILYSYFHMEYSDWGKKNWVSNTCSMGRNMMYILQACGWKTSCEETYYETRQR
jgi:hypothetical protein